MDLKLEFEALYEISKLLSGSLNLEATVPYIFRLPRKLMGFESMATLDTDGVLTEEELPPEIRGSDAVKKLGMTPRQVSYRIHKSMG